jgi:hypothetical protein
MGPNLVQVTKWKGSTPSLYVWNTELRNMSKVKRLSVVLEECIELEDVVYRAQRHVERTFEN